ncbi:MAG: C45 family peptidase [Eubacteriales bacterium]|nr:C45 family peptidase [Eubacteriales bacterium]
MVLAQTQTVETPDNQKKRWTLKRVLLTILFVILALLLAAVIAVAVLFRKEFGTVATLQQQDDFYFTMDYKADYGLDEFLETGASTDSELAAFIVKKLMKGLPVEISLPNLGCSAFAAQTPEGDWIFGRNFDNAQAAYALVHTEPQDGYESISMVNLSYIGFGDGSALLDKVLALAAPYIPLDGVNEAGLSIGVLQLYNEPTAQETGKTPITTTSAIRMVLDKAATVDEAIALMQQYDMHSSANAPYHFQLADANGDSATVEYIDGEMSVVRAADGEKLATTNFVLSEGEEHGDGKGQDRWQILTDTLRAKNGTLTEEEAMDLLEAVKQEKTKDDGTFSGTLWSCVYNNTDRTLQLSCNRDYEEIRTYTVDWE